MPQNHLKRANPPRIRTLWDEGIIITHFNVCLLVCPTHIAA